MPTRDAHAQTLSARRPAIAAGHVGAGPGQASAARRLPPVYESYPWLALLFWTGLIAAPPKREALRCRRTWS
jgi:hypothetical protein